MKILIIWRNTKSFFTFYIDDIIPIKKERLEAMETDPENPNIKIDRSGIRLDPENDPEFVDTILKFKCKQTKNQGPFWNIFWYLSFNFSSSDSDSKHITNYIKHIKDDICGSIHLLTVAVVDLSNKIKDLVEVLSDKWLFISLFHIIYFLWDDFVEDTFKVQS
jgi:hypothetical protein